jgi:hypothetical protein
MRKHVQIKVVNDKFWQLFCIYTFLISLIGTEIPIDERCNLTKF